ncbi:MAG: histidinol dehydrogenase [Candidatus Aminicenantes bacterium]|nr:histidinol dehydrogenase [Candidatus Aminicenantes bacterium]
MVRIIRAKDFKLGSDWTISSAVIKKVRRIISEVRLRGDEAVFEYTRLFDGVELRSLRVKQSELKQVAKQISPALSKAIQTAVDNLYLFSKKQFSLLKKLNELKVEMRPGVVASQKMVPIKRIGIYVPGGRYPLISSLIMAAVPARVAGVKEIAVCSPPGKDGRLPPAILYVAEMLKIEEVYPMGGAQAVAALACGTQSIKQVDKIVGPGNVYVTAAKKELYGLVGIDFIAGPTELLIIADGEAKEELVAADLIAQAEHDPLARPWLITDTFRLAEAVRAELSKQLKEWSEARTAARSLAKQGLIIIVDRLEDAVELANEIAPEHLALMVKKPAQLAYKLKNFGSLFIGQLTTEALGDYSSGLNHILPTSRAARYTGGLSVKDFLKFQTVLEVSRKGLKEIGPAAVSLAEAEGLFGHAASVRRRL